MFPYDISWKVENLVGVPIGRQKLQQLCGEFAAWQQEWEAKHPELAEKEAGWAPLQMLLEVPAPSDPQTDMFRRMLTGDQKPSGKLRSTDRQFLSGQAMALSLLHDLTFVGTPNIRSITDGVVDLNEEWLRKMKRDWDDDWEVWSRWFETALAAVQACLAAGKPEETEQKAAPGQINIQNFTGLLGDVNQSDNLQVVDHTQIQEITVTQEKTRGIPKKVRKIVGVTIVSIIAAVVTDILGDFGLIEGIKAFIYRIVVGR